MKINKKKQRGATLATWLIVAGIGGVIASGIIKVAPYYMEFNSVKGLMKNIASEPSIKKANLRQINAKVEKHLNVNSLYALEKAYYKSRGKKSENPFKLTRLRKGDNKRVLTVRYGVTKPWIGNLSFLVNFKHSVILGEPETAIEIKDKPVER